MHITLVTIGSRGDVQPYLALGKALKTAGYQVQLVTHTTFGPDAAQNGLDFGAVPTNPQEILATEAGQAWVNTGGNILKFLHQQIKLTQAFMRRLVDETWEACNPGTDLVIFSLFGIPGFHIAEKLKVPCVAAWLQPLSRTGDFPSLIVPPTWQLTQPANYISHVLAELAMWLPFQHIFNRWRVETLGLRPLSLAGPFHNFKQQQIPIIYGYSPTVLPRPADWPEQATVCGYWFLDQAKNWQSPPALTEFLAAGPAPVYVGFGSMPSRDPTALFEQVVMALRQTRQRGLILSGWSGLVEQPGQFGEEIFVLKSAPHDWLFPRMAAVVHHGGAGTTAAGLRAGVPSVIVPFFGDQPFWGQRVAALGVGPPPIMRQDLTVERLAQAIRVVTTDMAMRKNAAVVGHQIRAEDGLARAVTVITQHLERHTAGHRRSIAK